MYIHKTFIGSVVHKESPDYITSHIEMVFLSLYIYKKNEKSRTGNIVLRITLSQDFTTIGVFNECACIVVFDTIIFLLLLKSASSITIAIVSTILI